MYTSKCSDAMPAPLQLSCFCRSCIGKDNDDENFNDAAGSSGSGSNSASSKIGRNKNTKKGNSSSDSNTNKLNGDVNNPAQHLPYHLSAMVCHLGASLSSGHYVSYVRLESSDLGGSTCPEPNNFSVYTADTPVTNSLSNNQQISGIKSESFNTNDSGNQMTDNCDWSQCCALKLDQLLPNKLNHNLQNGVHSDYDSKSNVRSKTNSSADNKTKSSNKNGSHKVNNGKQLISASYFETSANNSYWLECDDEKIKLIHSSEVRDKMKGTLITPYLLFYSRQASDT